MHLLIRCYLVKGIAIVFFILILLGCSQQDFKNQEQVDPKGLIEKQLKSAREATKHFLSDPESAKFRNQVGDCGEVSYREESSTYSTYKRFVVIAPNIVFIEGDTDQIAFRLAWKNACRPSWN